MIIKALIGLVIIGAIIVGVAVVVDAWMKEQADR